jgi:hypothetical protein
MGNRGGSKKATINTIKKAKMRRAGDRGWDIQRKVNQRAL